MSGHAGERSGASASAYEDKHPNQFANRQSSYMNWRDLTIGSIITLAVTVIGGLLVYFLTRPSSNYEMIIYQIDQPATFSSEKEQLTLSTVRIGNVGNGLANNVKITILFENS